MPRRKPQEKKEVEELHTGDLLLPDDFDPDAPQVDDSLLSVDTGDLVLPDDFDPDAPPVPGGMDLKNELFSDLPPSGASALIPLDVEPGRRGGGRIFRSGSTAEAHAVAAAEARALQDAEARATHKAKTRATEAADALADEARAIAAADARAAAKLRAGTAKAAEAAGDAGELDPPTAKAAGGPAPSGGGRAITADLPPPVERRSRPRPARAGISEPFPVETDKGPAPLRGDDPGLTNSEIAALDEVAREIEEEHRPAPPKEERRPEPAPKAPRETARARQPRPGADAEAQPLKPRSRRPEQLPTELPAEQRADQVERAAQRFQAELDQRKAKTPVPPPVAPAEPAGPITRLLPVEDETATREITLVIVAGPDRGEHKLAKSETVLGRGSGCDIRLGHSSISRQHASVLRRGPRTLVKDLGSQNGTAVNDRRLAGDQELEVYAGDSVLVGQVACRLEGPGILARPAGFAVPSRTSMSPAPVPAWLKAAVAGAAVAAVTAVVLVVLFASGREATPVALPAVPAAPAEAPPAARPAPAEAPPSAVAAVPAAPRTPPAPAVAAVAAPAAGPDEPAGAVAEEEDELDEPAVRKRSSRSSKRSDRRRDRSASTSSARSSRGSADDAFEQAGASRGKLPRRGAEDDRTVARDALTLFKAGDLDGSIETAGELAPRLADELRGFKKAFADGNGSLGFQDAPGAIAGYTRAFRIHTQLTGGRGRFASELKEKLAKLHFVEGHRALSAGDDAAARRELQQALKYDPEHGAARRDLDRLDGGGESPAPRKKNARSAADDAWESSE